MSDNPFVKATKQDAKLRMAITGPSGSGKTYTALLTATKLGKTAVLDTEKGSAKKYADLFNFDVLELDRFDPAYYIAAIKRAVEFGYEVIVLDSLTHAWAGTGGILEIVDIQKKKEKNQFSAWNVGTQKHNELIDAILQSDIHIIGTMRSKTEYVIGDDKKPKKIGMAPVQRDGFEYEFDIIGSMDMDNDMVIEKSRCSVLSGQVIRKADTVTLADTLRAWLSDGETSTPQPEPEPRPTLQPDQKPKRNSKPAPQPPAKPPATERGSQLWEDYIKGWTQKEWFKFRKAYETPTLDPGLTEEEAKIVLGEPGKPLKSFKDFKGTRDEVSKRLIAGNTAKREGKPPFDQPAEPTTEPGQPFDAPEDDDEPEPDPFFVGDSGYISCANVTLTAQGKDQRPLITIYAIDDQTGEDIQKAVINRELTAGEADELKEIIPAKISKRGTVIYDKTETPDDLWAFEWTRVPGKPEITITDFSQA